MSILQKLSANKIGIGLVIAHWFIIPLTVALFLPSHFINIQSNGIFGMILLITIVVCDLPAILPAMLLCLPIYLFSEDKTDFWNGVMLVSFFTITYQWLFVGKAIYNTFSSKAAKPITLSLNDE